MKRILLITISLICVISLIACGTGAGAETDAPADTVTDNVTETKSPEPTETELTETETVDTEPMETEPADTEEPGIYAQPSAATGDVAEYFIDEDTISGFVLSLAASDGINTDGVELYYEVHPETYSGDTVLIDAELFMYNRDENGEIYGYRNIVKNCIVRYHLGTGGISLVEAYDYYEDDDYIQEKYGFYRFTFDGTGYEFRKYDENERYILYRNTGTANLRLLDKQTGGWVTIFEWNDYDDGAARGAFLWGDKYVFFTESVPDYYLVSSEECVKTKYVYDIETGDLREYMNGYSIHDIVCDTLYMYTQDEDDDGHVTRSYYSVDLSAGLDSGIREEPFMSGADTYDFHFSSDGRYIVYYSRDDDNRLTFSVYDRTSGGVDFATLTNEWAFTSFNFAFLIDQEGAFVVNCMLVEDKSAYEVGEDCNSSKIFIVFYYDLQD